MEFKNDTIKRFKELSDSIKDNLQYKEGSIQEKVARGSYIGNLPTGITEDTINVVSKYNTEFVTSSHVAVAEIAAGVFNKQKDINSLEASIGFFGPKDAVNISVDRSKVFQNHLAKTEEDREVTKHLFMSTHVDIKAAKGTSLKSVKDSIGEEFSGSFKK